MNNGTSRESRHGIAILEHEDLDTFIAFCEYAYTGDYTVPSSPGQRDDGNASKIWNGFVRSTSICSVVPPPAPTPPCTGRGNGHVERTSQDVSNCTTVRPETEVSGEAPVSPAQTAQDAAQPTSQAEQSTTNAYGVNGDAGIDTVNIVSKDKKGKKHKRPSRPVAHAATVPFPRLEPEWIPPTTPLVNKPLEELARSTANCASERPLSPRQVAHIERVDQKGHTPTFSEAETIWTEKQREVAPEANPAGPEIETDEETVVTDVFEEDNDRPSHQPSHHDSNPEPDRRRPSHVIDTSFFHQRVQHPPPRQRDRGVHLWDEFINLRYPVPRRSSYRTRTRSSLPSHQFNTSDPNTTTTATAINREQPIPPPLPYLLFHAKLYVFATKYLIPSLAQLCLRNLHADLIHLSLPDQPPLPLDAEQELRGRAHNPQLQAQIHAHLHAVAKAEMILDLLHYTYTHTTRLEPISLTSATQLRDNELRWLVVHYAACKIRVLARLCSSGDDGDGGGSAGGIRPRKQGLRALLDTTPELASDLIYCLI